MTPMRLLCVLLVLGCQSVLANPISNIRVFHSDDVPVREDLKLPPSMVVHVYNMDTKNNATAKLNEMVKAKLGSNVGPSNYRDANQQAFSEVLNGPHWRSLYNEMEAGGEAIEYAIRFRIKKLPAIVFNDKSVVYGVTSLQEAIRIFNNKGGDR